MYKIFFGDRIISLGENGGEYSGKGLVYQYEGREALQELIEAFIQNDQMQELHLHHEDLGGLRKAFRSCFRFLKAGGGLVRNPAGSFLLIKRNGVWDLPKGKLEKGEDFAEAALREVEEECGLQGLILKQLLTSTFHTYPLKEKMVLKETQWFGMLYEGSRDPLLQAEEGITEYRWAEPGKAAFVRENTYASILDVLKLGKML